MLWSAIWFYNVWYSWAGAVTIGLTSDPTKSGIKAEQSTAQLYFKVANAVQNLELLNVGEVMEAVADKISRQDCVAYVTETFRDGASWYRVYSDGWCEQGGTISNDSSSMSFEVSLLKPFNDVNYNVVVTSNHPTTTDKGWDYAHSFTTSSFQMVKPAATACWQASGYIS